MIRSFNHVKEFLNAARGPFRGERSIKGTHFEGLGLRGCGCLMESSSQEAVNGLLEWFAGASNLFLQQSRYIVIDGESGSHIMMLASEAS